MSMFSGELLSAEQIAQRVGGMRLVAGDGYEALAVRPGPVPRIERAWLPAPAVVARHLPRWSLSVQRDGVDWVMQERGLPLAALIACQAAGMGCLMQEQWHQEIHAAYEAQEGGGPRSLPEAPVEQPEASDF